MKGLLEFDAAFRLGSGRSGLWLGDKLPMFIGDIFPAGETFPCARRNALFYCFINSGDLTDVDCFPDRFPPS